MEEESSAKTEENVAKTTWSTMLMPSAILSGVSLSFTSIAHLLMTIVGGVLCFLPCFLGTPSCVETSILRASLSSVEYGYAAVTLIISAAPLIIEMITDGFLHVYRSSFIQNKQQSSFILDTNVIAPYTYSFNTPEKVLFIVGIIIQPLVAFLPSDTNNLGQLYICCNKCQIMLVAGTFNTWLCRYDPRHFSVCTAYMFLGVLVVSMSLQVFGDNMSNCSNLDQGYPNMETLRQVGFYLVWVSVAIFFYNVIRWLFYKVPMLLQHVPTVPGIMFSVTLYEHNHQWFSSLYVISSILCLVFEGIISATAPKMADYQPQQLVLGNVSYIFFVCSISVLALRTMKFEAVQGLYALVESNRTYARYVSHEEETMHPGDDDHHVAINHNRPSMNQSGLHRSGDLPIERLLDLPSSPTHQNNLPPQGGGHPHGNGGRKVSISNGAPDISNVPGRSFNTHRPAKPSSTTKWRNGSGGGLGVDRNQENQEMIALSSMQESKSDEMHDNEAAFNANRGLVFSSGTQLSYPLSAVERRSATDYSNFEVAPSPQSNIFTTPHDTPFDRMLKTRGGLPQCHAYKSSPPNFSMHPFPAIPTAIAVNQSSDHPRPNVFQSILKSRPPQSNYSRAQSNFPVLIPRVADAITTEDRNRFSRIVYFDDHVVEYLDDQGREQVYVRSTGLPLSNPTRSQSNSPPPLSNPLRSQSNPPRFQSNLPVSVFCTDDKEPSCTSAGTETTLLIPTSNECNSHLSNRQSNSTALPVKSDETGRHTTSHQLIQSTSQKASQIQTHNFHAHSPVLVESAVEGRNDSDLYVNSPQSNLQSSSVAPPVKSEERNGSNLYISSGGRDWLRRQLYR